MYQDMESTTVDIAQRSGGRIRGKQLYDFRLVEAHDLQGYENAIGDIQSRKYDGILVRGAIPHDVCDQINSAAANLGPDVKVMMPVGWTFPPIFAALVGQAFKNGEEEGIRRMKAYFKLSEEFYHNSASYLGVDTTALIEQWLGAFSGGLPLSIAKGYDNEGQYANCSYRAYYGNGEGNISIHCANYFQTAWQKFFSHLETQTDVYDQLSFFFLLQEPESGGELTLYDFEWKKGQTKKSNHENKEVIMEDGSIRYIDGEEVQIIDPKKGDLVLFAGGQIWHRVEEVLGTRERITMGGFLDYGWDRKKVFYWS
jgi:hapalindole-type alkaloid chlorinase